eukprot:c1349_g1_i1 orf=3-257(-)
MFFLACFWDQVGVPIASLAWKNRDFVCLEGTYHWCVCREGGGLGDMQEMNDWSKWTEGGRVKKRRTIHGGLLSIFPGNEVMAAAG